MKYCAYYQAIIAKPMVWFVTGSLRNEDGWAFDRALDSKTGLHEFFVAPAFEQRFLDFMHTFERMGYVEGLQKLPNRAMTEDL